MKRRRVALFAALLLLFLAASAAIDRIPPTPSKPLRAAESSPAPSAPAVGVYRRPSPPAVPAELHGIPLAEARAYAAVGSYADGRSPNVVLDAESTAARAQAEENLATQAPEPGAGRRQVLPGGVTMAIAPRRKASGQRSAVVPTSPAGAAIAPASVPLEVTTIALPGDISRQDAAHVIRGRGVWAGINLHPDDGPLRIVDAGEGGYAFTCWASDFGTVRVNGGIVVPGRHYRIQGEVTITSAVEMGVDIVPLEAVPEYWNEPFTVPTGAG